ncbi:MAG TPA: PQQ-dependent sugar dehydrogenase [Nakamurella sp.]
MRQRVHRLQLLTFLLTGGLVWSNLAGGFAFAADATDATGADSRQLDAGLPQPAAASGALPDLTFTPLVQGLSNPWDVEFTPDGTMLFDVLRGGLGAVLPGGEVRTMTADFHDNFTGNESGVMGMAIDPDFAQNRDLYLCQTLWGPDHATPGVGARNAIIKWHIGSDYRSATRVSTIVDGLRPVPLPADPQGGQGRHVGCRLRFDGAGLLYITIGDGRTPTGPDDITSPMGKVLRVTTAGEPAPGNPFITNPDPVAKMVFTYGHRNPQGLALQPGTGLMWEDEHGPDIDDEINLLSAGSDYGWNPVGPGGVYQDNGTPMTRPGAVTAWSSGDPTIATSGSTFLTGSQWGGWDGALAVATLKEVSLRLFSVSGAAAAGNNPAGAGVQEVASTTIDGAGLRVVPPARAVTAGASANPIGTQLSGSFGRLRTAQLGPDGALYVTTSNGNGTDEILRVVASPPCAGSADDPTPSGVGAARTDSGTTAFVRGTDDGVWFRSTDPAAGYDSLGGRIQYGPTAVSWGGNRLDVFAIGTDGALYHRAGGAGASFGGWEYLGGALTSSPAALSFAQGTLNVYARGTDGQLWTMAWTGTAWTDWSPLGGVLASAPGAAVDPDSGTATVGVRGTDGRLYELRFASSGPGGITNVGTPICSAPAYAARAGDGNATTLAYRSGDLGLQVAGSAIGGVITSAPALLADPAGPEVSAFGRGTDGALWMYRGVPGTGSWLSLGGALN